MNNSFNQEVLTLVHASFCLLGFFSVSFMFFSKNTNLPSTCTISKFSLICLGGECGFSILSVVSSNKGI